MEAEAKSTSDKTWCSINRVQRRVLGVLVEKSKTTPDIYPMTINAITTASNQKSNRKPLMQLDPEDVENALSELREKGAVVELQSDARKPKYKHLLYQWLGVGKVELAVMAELLLRGEQTLGDLRGRAARMEKISDITELKPIVNGLMEKHMIIALTPEGRGQIVTHNLYQPEELAKLEREMSSLDHAHQRTDGGPPARQESHTSDNPDLRELSDQVAELQAEMAQLKDRLDLLEQRD